MYFPQASPSISGGVPPAHRQPIQPRERWGPRGQRGRRTNPAIQNEDHPVIGWLLTRCEAAGVVLIVESDKLHVECEGDPPPELIEELRRHKPEVIEALSSVPVETAEVIAPACWVTGAAGNSFEMPCSERRGLIERLDRVFL